MTTEDINKYIDRSKLPDAKRHYTMTGKAMAAFLTYGEAEANRHGLIDAIWSVTSLAYRYGMAAGYRLGRR